MKAHSSWFIDAWAQAEDNGTPIYQLVTANRLQVGKTSFALKAAERIEEELHGRKYTIENLEFEIRPFIARKHEVPEWTPVILDEPNRPAGNRSWWSEEVKLLNEDLQTGAFEHKHCLFPLPHEHLFDFAAASVCTSHVIIDRKGHAIVYGIQRDQLNRQFKTRTPYRGELDFTKPSPELWHDYLKKREAYRGERRKMILDKLAELANRQGTILTVTEDQVLEAVMATPANYIGGAGGNRISPTRLMTRFKEDFHQDLSYARCQKLAALATDRLRAKEKAEIP